MKPVAVFVILCISHPLALALALDPRYAETEGGVRPVDDWNAQLEEKLIRELSRSQGHQLEDEPQSLELELAPAEKEEQQIVSVQGNDGHPLPSKKGQPEYMSFVDLSAPNAARKMHESPVAEVKRANEASINFNNRQSSWADTVFMVTVVGGVACAMVGVVLGAVVVRRRYKAHDSARESEYPQYGVTGPGKDKKKGAAAGDTFGAYQAQLAHYKETKQKIISTEQMGTDIRQHESDESDEGEQEEGDFSVYECPGLAPTGDIEVSNPMFDGKDGGTQDGD